jgi:hypothetical protein
MEQSILKSTKKILNIGVDDTSFDQDIITHINSALSHLHQLGIGPNVGFAIDSDEEVWNDFLEGEPTPILSAVKTNVHLRVRAIFDPPQLPHVMSAMQAQLLESDVRLNTMREETGWTDPDPLDLEEDEFGDPLIIDGGDA